MNVNASKFCSHILTSAHPYSLSYKKAETVCKYLRDVICTLLTIPWKLYGITEFIENEIGNVKIKTSIFRWLFDIHWCYLKSNVSYRTKHALKLNDGFTCYNNVFFTKYVILYYIMLYLYMKSNRFECFQGLRILKNKEHFHKRMFVIVMLFRTSNGFPLESFDLKK